MRKTIVDMFVKQCGSYERLIAVAKATYPDLKPINTQTVIMQDVAENGKWMLMPVLMLTFETNRSDDH